MSNLPSDRVRTLFEQATALEPAARAAFLDAACGGDAGLRAELRSLLEAFDASDGFFEELGARLTPPAPGAAARVPVEGERVAQYEVGAVVGAGGMGIVCRARDTRLGRTVALKFLPPHLGRDPGAAAGLLREARAASALEHPNIATIYEVGEFGEGGVFLAMAWCPGETLRRKLGADRLAVTDAVAIAVQIADALAAAHRAGIVHRDVKPANIIVGNDGVVKLVDFGIARPAGVELTRGSGTFGTVAYMSPEQTRGGPPDARTDVWSLGVVLYEMLAARPPFRGGDEAVLIHAIRNDEPEPIADVRDDVSAALAALVTRCLDKDPARRGDAAAVAAALRRIAAGGTGGAWRTAPRLRRSAAAATAVVLAALLGVGSYWAAARPPPGELDAQRLLIAPLENRTGDPALEPVGSMAADWLIQGLAQSGLVDVVPVTTSLAASRHVRAGGPAEAGGVLRALAEETRAGIVITGAFYRQRDSLYFGVTITDVAGRRVLEALDPVAVPFDRPADGIDLLRQEVLRSAAQHLNPRLQRQAAYIRAPPSFEAYRDFAVGLELFVAADWPAAIERLLAANAADSTFVMPLVYAAIAYGNSNEHAAMDSILARLRPRRAELAPFEALAYDMLVATIAGDLHAYYRAHLDAPRMAPNALAHYGLGLGALLINRPAEAVAVFRSLDPERGELRGWLAYWTQRTLAEHRLGRHRDELRSVQRARSLHPVEQRVVQMEAVALAALGRRRQLDALLRRARDAHPQPHVLLRVVGLELIAHGDSATGTSLLRESLDAARQPLSATSGHRFFLARAHYLLGEYTEARSLLLPLLEELPESIDVRGLAGTLAARSGDVAGAREADAWLAALDRPYMFGLNTYLRASIAAQLGESDEAVRLLRQSWREGQSTHIIGHTDPDLQPLLRHRGFQEFMRPAG
jgi:tetratricopeptide (TPR) repeat protein